MAKHVVKRGESIATIAGQHGVQDPRALHEHPSNSKLRRQRPDSSLLFPGDEVEIPELRPKSVSCKTGTSAKLEVKLPAKRIRIVLRDLVGQPLSGVEYRLAVGGREFSGQTAADGLVAADVDARASEGTLSLNGGEPQSIAVDDLNPMRDVPDEGVSGVQARLRNLGYLSVPVDGVLGPLTREAIRDYEKRHGMKETGEISGPLVGRLEREHGC